MRPQRCGQSEANVPPGFPTQRMLKNFRQALSIAVPGRESVCKIVSSNCFNYIIYSFFDLCIPQLISEVSYAT